VPQVILSTWQGQVIGSPDGHVPLAQVKMPNFPDAFEDGRPLKAFMGWAGVIVQDNSVNMVDMAREYMKKAQQESCGQCIPCRMGTRVMLELLDYSSAEEIFQELSRLTPSYAGMSYPRLEEQGLQRPCPNLDHPGTPILHVNKFARGKGLFHPIEYTPPAEKPDTLYPFLLTTGRYYYHYHTGSMTRRSKALDMLCPEGFVEIHPQDAVRLSLEDGDTVRLKSRRGAIEIKVKKSERCPPGVLFVSFHFQEATVNLLTNSALDPVAKTPEFKVCAVALEKL